MVALRKPNGRVRALVVGDVFRRLVARALAQQFSEAFQSACLPFQYGLGTRAGTEALSKVLRVATELDPRATVLSVDAVGAYDHVSRQAMQEGLRSRPELAPLLPFARQFYGSESRYIWVDDAGNNHIITQGEGGEQGDPLMPALYSLAQHGALEAFARQMQPGEAVLAFLDDTYVVSNPERTRPARDALSAALWHHARVRLNEGKTRIWNAAGEEPPGIADLQPPDADPLWTGSWSLPRERQGIVVLGAPLGSDEFVRCQLQAKRQAHDRLLECIPGLGDLQAAWLLLHFCAATRANFLLRMLPPVSTAEFAEAHDAAVTRCLGRLLYDDESAPIPPAAWRVLHLPLRFGGLGLRSAAEAAQSAWWASWFDSLPAIRVRAPDVAERLVQGLEAQGGSEPPSLVSARNAAALLRGRGFEVPPWHSFSPVPPGDGEPDDPLRGWQRRAAMVCDERALEMHLSDLDTASRALLLSQAGPHAGRALTVRPTATELLIPPAQFRVLLLRRLRLPLQLAPRTCSCHGHLDALGDHRSACATSGVLAPRALPLERAVARVCREAGGRVCHNVRLADMNVDVPIADARRIEVVANGLSLWNGAQLAVDATIGPVTRRGEAQPGADVRPGRPSTPRRAVSDSRRTPSWRAPGAAAWWSSGSR